MPDMNQPVTFAQAMHDFFYRQGIDTTKSFMDEFRALTNEDKAEFRSMLESIGYTLKSA